MIPVVTIDGPGGSGKGTVGLAVAARLGWGFLDSGALYRLLAHAAAQQGIAPGDPRALAALAARMDIRFEPAGEEVRVLLDGRDVSDAIRTERCGRDASEVAALPPVREALLARQRAFRRAPGLVADGRDMGTVVFPDAPVKIFLTASARERAERRYKQLKDKGNDVSLAELVAQIQARDERDSTRAVAPLKPAGDAVLIDTTGTSVDQVVQAVMRVARERLPEQTTPSP